MNRSQLTRLAAFAAVFAAAAAAAPAALAQTHEAALSRAEVNEATKTAIASGHMMPAGELNMAQAPMVSEKTREQRKAETLAANRNGALSAPGSVLYYTHNVAPRVALAASTKTRADRKAETMQAIKQHQIMGAGEAG